MNTYFIADTHFGHESIIHYENRPFAEIYEMDEQLINNWNEVVEEGDQVFVLGDFSFYTKEKTHQICQRLKGKKILIRGNHDLLSLEKYMACGFEQVSNYPIILEQFWMLSHDPLYINENMPYANIFGHVHSSSIYTNYSHQSYCVCVERIDYTPISFAEIKKRIPSK